MMYDGRKYQKNRWVGWREAVTGDKYTDGAVTHHEGEQICSNHVVVFRVKDAPKGIVEDQEVFYPRDVSSDKLIPMCAHTATHEVLGVPKKVTGSHFGNPKYNVGRSRGLKISWHEEFIEQAHYLVHDAQVYQWTSRRPAEQEDGI